MLDGEDLEAAYYCAREVWGSRKLKGQPIPSWLVVHYRRLDTAVRMSRSGHEKPCGAEESSSARSYADANGQQISAREASVILGLSKRQTRRIATSLGGQLVDGRWVFRRSDVIEYREGMRDGHPAGRA